MNKAIAVLKTRYWQIIAGILLVATLVMAMQLYGFNRVDIAAYYALEQELNVLKYQLECAESNKQAQIEWGKFKDTEMDKLTSEYSDKCLENDKLQNQIVALNREISQLQGEKAILTEKAYNAEKKAADLGGQIFYYRDRMADLQTESDTFKSILIGMGINIEK